MNTALTSEYYVMYLLSRLDIDANLTIGNKKKVDIFVSKDGFVKTIDVKGLSSNGDFIVGDYEKNISDENHYYIFVYFKNADISNDSPEVFIVPSTKIAKIVVERSGVNNVSVKSLRDNYQSDINQTFVELFR